MRNNTYTGRITVTVYYENHSNYFCLVFPFYLTECMHSRFGAPPRAVTWVTSRARDGARAACRGQQKHRSQSFWSGFGLCSTAFVAGERRAKERPRVRTSG